MRSWRTVDRQCALNGVWDNLSSFRMAIKIMLRSRQQAEGDKHEHRSGKYYAGLNDMGVTLTVLRPLLKK